MSHLNTFHLDNSASVAWTRGRSPTLETYPTHFFLLITNLIHFHRAQVDSAVKPRWARPASNSRCTSSCFISSKTATARRRHAILQSPLDYQARLCPVVAQIQASRHEASPSKGARAPPATTLGDWGGKKTLAPHTEILEGVPRLSLECSLSDPRRSLTLDVAGPMYK